MKDFFKKLTCKKIDNSNSKLYFLLRKLCLPLYRNQKGNKMKEVFKVMAYTSEEPILENLSSYESAERYILSRQNPDDYYVGWDEVTEEEYEKISFND